MNAWRYRIAVPPLVLLLALLLWAAGPELGRDAGLPEGIACLLLLVPPGCIATLLTLLLSMGLAAVLAGGLPWGLWRDGYGAGCVLAAIPLAWGLDRRQAPLGRLVGAWGWLTGLLLVVAAIARALSGGPWGAADLWLCAVRVTSLVGWGLLALVGASGLLYPRADQVEPLARAFEGRAQAGDEAPRPWWQRLGL